MDSFNNEHWIPTWDLPKISKPLRIEQKWGFLGSCFAENFSVQFKQLGLDCWANPGGTLYNPLSILRQLERLLNPKPFEKSEFYYYGNTYHHLLFDTHFMHPNSSELLNNLERTRLHFLERFQNTHGVFISLGTNQYFNWKQTKQIVTNCHKIPPTYFDKVHLHQLDCQLAISHLKQILFENGIKQIVFTLSPVRYPKQGLAGNSLSKATLRLAIENSLCEHSQYFPIGEILLDELRDYRFYSEDKKHPSTEAQNYLFERGVKALFDETQLKYFKIAQNLKKLKSHRVLHSWQNAELEKALTQKRQDLFKLNRELGTIFPDSILRFIEESTK